MCMHLIEDDEMSLMDALDVIYSKCIINNSQNIEI